MTTAPPRSSDPTQYPRPAVPAMPSALTGGVGAASATIVIGSKDTSRQNLSADIIIPSGGTLFPALRQAVEWAPNARVVLLDGTYLADAATSFLLNSTGKLTLEGQGESTIITPAAANPASQAMFVIRQLRTRFKGMIFQSLGVSDLTYPIQYTGVGSDAIEAGSIEDVWFLDWQSIAWPIQFNNVVNAHLLRAKANNGGALFSASSCTDVEIEDCESTNDNGTSGSSLALLSSARMKIVRGRYEKINGGVPAINLQTTTESFIDRTYVTQTGSVPGIILQVEADNNEIVGVVSQGGQQAVQIENSSDNELHSGRAEGYFDAGIILTGVRAGNGSNRNRIHHYKLYSPTFAGIATGQNSIDGGGLSAAHQYNRLSENEITYAGTGAGPSEPALFVNGSTDTTIDRNRVLSWVGQPAVSVKASSARARVVGNELDNAATGILIGSSVTDTGCAGYLLTGNIFHTVTTPMNTNAITGTVGTNYVI